MNEPQIWAALGILAASGQIPAKALSARSDAPHGLGPRLPSDQMASTTPAIPTARPSQSNGPLRRPPSSGVSAATKAGCSDMMMAVVPAFIPRFMAK